MTFRGLTGRSVFLVAAVGLMVGSLASSGYGDERRFHVMLAWPTKSVEDPAALQQALEDANPGEIYNWYFRMDGDDGIDSFAEYWDEISYGNVNVSGSVDGWVEVPWPVFPEGVATNVVMGYTLPFDDLNISGGFTRFAGEDMNQFLAAKPR